MRILLMIVWLAELVCAQGRGAAAAQTNAAATPAERAAFIREKTIFRLLGLPPLNLLDA